MIASQHFKTCGVAKYRGCVPPINICITFTDVGTFLQKLNTSKNKDNNDGSVGLEMCETGNHVS